MERKRSSFISKNSIKSIAIGGFDGMHKAHQKLFESLCNDGAILVIQTSYANLTPKIYREEYSTLPLFYYNLVEIKSLDGKSFISLLKKDFPLLKKIVVGYDFCFGKNRKYCIRELKKLFDGEVIVIDEYLIDNISIHSKKIRELLKDNQLDLVNKFLGRDYKIYGTSIKGQGIGSKELVPTINLNVTDFLLPFSGVYKTKTIIKNKIYNSITFIGNRVTTDNIFSVETHLIDKNIDNVKLNSEIAIIFIEKIRENIKFNSLDELKKQILKDINYEDKV